jgi:hypothetical protein
LTSVAGSRPDSTSATFVAARDASSASDPSEANAVCGVSTTSSRVRKG